MIYPTIDELTKGKFNRYELVVGVSKSARIVTDEYVAQHDAAEKTLANNKESDKPLNSMIDKELRDEKAVHVAVNRLRDGVYVIDPEAGARVEEPAEAVDAATEEAPASEASDGEE